MAITYQVEPWECYYPECQALWLAHWIEVALTQAEVPLDPDVDRYQALADAGQLHILSMRDAGKLVGYHVTICTMQRALVVQMHGRGAPVSRGRAQLAGHRD